MFKLSSGEGLPKVRRSLEPRRRKYPFEDMGVGDYFFVPHKAKNTLATHVSTVGKQTGRKFATRLTFMATDKRGNWSLCDPDAPGAVQGVGVWRVS